VLVVDGEIVAAKFYPTNVGAYFASQTVWESSVALRHLEKWMDASRFDTSQVLLPRSNRLPVSELTDRLEKRNREALANIPKPPLDGVPTA
jgi:hypothetical protein